MTNPQDLRVSLRTPPPPLPTRKGPTALELVVGDLVDEAVDALVVPLAGSDLHRSRVALALARAAGPGLADELQRRLSRYPQGLPPPGRSVVTSAHGLASRFVIHTRLVDAASLGERAEPALAAVLDDVFETARGLGVESVALPALGTGSFGYRTSVVAEVSVRSALHAHRRLGAPPRIRFVLAGPSTLETFLHAASAVRAEG